MCRDVVARFGITVDGGDSLGDGQGVMRIFVDCDDTLVLYDADADVHPYGVLDGAPWRPNQPLVAALLATQHPVFVWSGGGKRYARVITRELGLPFRCLDKNETSLKLIQEGDVVIDDQDLGGRRTHNPFEWPEKAK